MKVCVAGTFNVIHDGHRRLLEKAFEIGNEIFIGLTSDEMARGHRAVNVRSFESRETNLNEEVRRLHGGKKYHIIRIIDEHGPAVSGDYDAIVVSEETRASAVEINEIRKNRGLTELEIIVIDMVLARDGIPFSSTRILKGEIDANQQS